MTTPTTARRDHRAVLVSPFEVAVHGQPGPLQVRTKADLLRSARRAEVRARRGTPADLVLVTVQHRRYWTRRTRGVFEAIAALGTVVVVFGVDLPTDLSGVVHRRPVLVGLDEDDLLADEWLVLFCATDRRWGVVSRVAAAGLPGARSGARRPLPDDGVPDLGREFLCAAPDDPVGVERAAAVLLTRVPELGLRVPWLMDPH